MRSETGSLNTYIAPGTQTSFHVSGAVIRSMLQIYRQTLGLAEGEQPTVGRQLEIHVPAPDRLDVCALLLLQLCRSRK